MSTSPLSASLLDADADGFGIPLHELGYNGNGVLICMLDAGYNNLEHDAFSIMDIMITRDFVNGDSIVWDQPGQLGNGNHGTNTLSVIGGFAAGPEADHFIRGGGTGTSLPGRPDRGVCRTGKAISGSGVQRDLQDV